MKKLLLPALCFFLLSCSTSVHKDTNGEVVNSLNPLDTTYTPRQEWLSRDWNKIVESAICYADSIGLGCDLTFGTLWPFGDSYVPFEEATQRYGDPEWRVGSRLCSLK